MMNLRKPKKTSNNTPKPDKESFDFNEFRHSFESLDTQNYGTWPLPVKLTVFVFIVLLIGALTWALPVSSKIDAIKAAESERATLLDTYREKESKAHHLQEYKDQIAQMETEFTALLDQLPKDTRVSELVEGINMTGVGSNIRFTDIKVEPEIEQEFFIEQPISINALGGYHEFGNFVSGLAALPRIITVHDFTVTPRSETPIGQNIMEKIPELNLLLQTKTYRSKEVVDTDDGTTMEAAQ